MTRPLLGWDMETPRRGRKAPTRRSVLAGTGALALSALSGCAGGIGGDDGGSDGPGGSTTDGTGTESTTSDAPTLGEHPAAAGLQSQPTRGPDPFEAEAVIIAFEDPSCHRCRAFEQQTVPRIESELVATGRGAFVFRGYPVIYPWGKPATQALESTYARDADAHWALKGHYFDEQSSFTESNVLDRTREFLDSETDLDAQAVVADAEASAHDAEVQSDLAAGMEAGAGGTTPSVFLFKDGRYRTMAAGSVSYSVVANALGL